ncbi:protein of unknown function [Legionella longbeachae NSW150]|uniref:Uncharacterized protein n=1 Tax=Legionella longbeachae serogroup 1 (strain NSW150) TaxID=661367 RepID=D3HKP6_LEGLN|nr:protein of unknown function [Legionella longbeachae NSW150]
MPVLSCNFLACRFFNDLKRNSKKNVNNYSVHLKLVFILLLCTTCLEIVRIASSKLEQLML